MLAGRVSLHESDIAGLARTLSGAVSALPAPDESFGSMEFSLRMRVSTWDLGEPVVVVAWSLAAEDRIARRGFDAVVSDPYAHRGCSFAVAREELCELAQQVRAAAGV